MATYQHKLEHEKRTISAMLRIYCRGNHGEGDLCPDCAELERYAHARLDNCNLWPDKPSCKECPVHCYRPDARERVREVMRYAGPRMTFRHPILAFRHIRTSLSGSGD